jgi:ABC-2 type transport system permease protein
MQRVVHMMRKELLELRQDPRLFGIIIIAPILQLAVLGYAATTDVKDVPIVVVDADRSTASRDLVTRFDASDHFSVVGVESSTAAIDDWLASGRAWIFRQARR